MIATNSQHTSVNQHQLSELMLDYAWRSFDRATNYFARIETKATTMAGLVGVMLTIVAACASQIFPNATFGIGKITIIAQSLYLIGVGCLICAFLLCAYSLRLLGTWEIPDTKDIIATRQSLEVHADAGDQFRRQVIGYLANAASSYYDVAAKKKQTVRHVGTTLMIGVSVFAAAGVCFVFRMVFQH